MKSLIIIFTIIIIISLFLILLFDKVETFLEYVESSINFKSYPVQDDLPKKELAANKLAKVEIFINNFVDYLNRNYPNDIRVQRLKDRLKDLNIQESEIKPGVSSYTVNKGELISVCVRNKDDLNEFHEFQLLLFVIIHELAHVASKSFGHNKEFNDNFEWLLKEAINVGYVPQDYSVNPVTYCGVDVTNNPFYY